MNEKSFWSIGKYFDLSTPMKLILQRFLNNLNLQGCILQKYLGFL